MRISTKATLFSALIFPGAGHLLLQRYLRAGIFIAVTIGCVGVLAKQAVDIATTIADKIHRGEISLDLERITQAIEAHTHAAQSQTADIATILLIVVWLGAMLDAYRVGLRCEVLDTHKV